MNFNKQGFINNCPVLFIKELIVPLLLWNSSFFPLALACRTLLESEWQQVSKGLLDSSQYFSQF